MFSGNNKIPTKYISWKMVHNKHCDLSYYTKLIENKNATPT